MAVDPWSSQIYVSTNSGAIWTQTGPSLNISVSEWVSVASSADGTKLVAATDIDAGIYASTNSGADWTQTSAPYNCWVSIASSADGNKLVAVSSSGIYTSTNSGVTWTQTSAPGASWHSVASSADGSNLVAVVNGGGIYISTNSGVAWTQTSAPNTNWYSVASSADGTKLAAVVNSGGIWIAQATIMPILTGATVPGSGQFQFVFNTISNVNYTIQYSTTLTNWTSFLTTNGYDGPLIVTDSNATFPQCFYRVMLQ